MAFDRAHLSVSTIHLPARDPAIAQVQLDQALWLLQQAVNLVQVHVMPLFQALDDVCVLYVCVTAPHPPARDPAFASVRLAGAHHCPQQGVAPHQSVRNSFRCGPRSLCMHACPPPPCLSGTLLAPTSSWLKHSTSCSRWRHSDRACSQPALPQTSM